MKNLKIIFLLVFFSGVVLLTFRVIKSIDIKRKNRASVSDYEIIHTSPSEIKAQITPVPRKKVTRKKDIRGSRIVPAKKTKSNTAQKTDSTPLPEIKSVPIKKDGTVIIMSTPVQVKIEEPVKIVKAITNIQEENKEKTQLEEEPAELPDLIITRILTSPEQFFVGNFIAFKAEIKNTSKIAIPAGIVIGISFKVNGILIGWSDYYNKGLAGESSEIITANAYLVDRHGWKIEAYEKFDILAVVDDVDRVDEHNENNNYFIRQNVTPTEKKGLMGTYFDTIDFKDEKVTRLDYLINFNWANRSPHSLIDPDSFSIRWEGFIIPPFSGKYTFTSVADDGFRLTVNNIKLINDWNVHNIKKNVASIDLRGGEPVPINIEYFEHSGNALVSLHWESELFPKQILQKQYLIPEKIEYADLSLNRLYWYPVTPAIDDEIKFMAIVQNVGTLPFPDNMPFAIDFYVNNSLVAYSDEYYGLNIGELLEIEAEKNPAGNYWFLTPGEKEVKAQLRFFDEAQEFNIENNFKKELIGYQTNFMNGIVFFYYEGQWTKLPNFAAEKPKDNGIFPYFSTKPKKRQVHFGLRFNAFLQIDKSGPYTFYLISDDGSKLYIDGKLVINNDGIHNPVLKTGKINLSQGKHSLDLHYFQTVGNNYLRLQYSGPEVSRRDIPKTHLFINNRFLETEYNRMKNKAESFDLVVTQLSANKKKIYHNDPLSFQISINNQGNAANAEDKNLTADVYINDILFESHFFTGTTIPANKDFFLIQTKDWIADAGINFIKVIVDKNNEFIENNENNNYKSMYVFVNDVLPDLVITGIRWEPANPKAGEVVNILASIKNEGKRATPANIEHDVKLKINKKSFAWRTAFNYSLPPGETVVVNVTEESDDITWKPEAGEYELMLKVDPFDRIDEQSIINNTYIKKININRN